MEEAGVERPGWGRLLLRATLRFWDARALALAAVHTPAWFAWLVGPVVLGCLTGAHFFAATWSMSEPYPDFSPLFDWKMIARCCAITTAVATPFLYLVAGFFAHSTALDDSDRRRHNAAIGRVVLLLPFALAPPLLAFLPLAVLATIAHPSNGILSGKPVWTTWRVWLAFHACFWLPVWIGLAFYQLVRAVGALSSFFPSPGACTRCAYPLADIRGGRCPECGKAMAPDR